MQRITKRLVAQHVPRHLLRAGARVATVKRPFSAFSVSEATSSSSSSSSPLSSPSLEALSNAAVSDYNLPSVLTPEQKATVSRIRFVLDRMTSDLKPLGLSSEEEQLIKRTVDSLDEMFLFVVVGEFNSGKSQFINALLGGDFCQTGVLPTTEHVHILRYGPKVQAVDESEHMRSLRLPIDWLKETNLVDTPGTNAVLAHHQAITEHFVPRSDFILFVTSVERPFSESERQFLTKIAKWRKKLCVVLSKVDLIDSEMDREKVMQFVKQKAKEVLHEEPLVFPVSGRSALAVKKQLQAARQKVTSIDELARLERRLQESGLTALQNYLHDSLHSQHRIQLKLLSPLGVAEQLMLAHQKTLSNRSAILTEDLKALAQIQADIEQFKSEVRADYEYQKTKLDNILLRLLNDTDNFLDQYVTLGNIPDLMRSESLKKAFNEQVNKNLAEEVQECLATMVDWMADRTNRQAQSLVKFLTARASADEEREDAASSASASSASFSPSSAIFGLKAKLLGSGGLEFDSSRHGLIHTLQRNARDVLATRNPQHEGEVVARGAKSAVLQTAVMEAGAIGIGGLFTAAMFDWTGIVHSDSASSLSSLAAYSPFALAGAGALAVSGLYLLPFRRARLKKQMRNNINLLRKQLEEVANKSFEQQLEKSVRSLEQALSPYSRWVNVQQGQLASLSSTLDSLSAEIKSIRQQIIEETDGAKAPTK